MRDAASGDERDECSADAGGDRIDDRDGSDSDVRRRIAITDRRTRRGDEHADVTADGRTDSRTDDGADHRANRAADSRADRIADRDPSRAAPDDLHRP